MTSAVSERAKIAALAWLATVLTSLSFFPALADKKYIFEAAFFTAIVIGVGIALRAVRAPTPVVCFVELIALTELLLLRFGESLRFGVLPTRATIDGVSDSISLGVDVAQKFAAPAPANDGLLLMVLAAIGVAAIAVDTVAVGLRRVPLSGLPLLALYTIPVTILPKGLSFVVFVPGAATYIAMLMADERDRLAHWGRLVSRNVGSEPSPLDLSSVVAGGRRVSLIALTFAVVTPIFLPAISASILDAGRGGGLGDGEGPVISFKDPMVGLASQLREREPVDLLRVVSDGATPEYLRLAVLANPGPVAWTADNIDLGRLHRLSLQPLPPPTGLSEAVAQTPQAMSISLTSRFPDDSAFLPIPFDVAGIDTNAPFGYVPSDQTAAAQEKDAIQQVSTYDVNYSIIAPSRAQLNAAEPPPPEIMAKYGAVPEGVSDDVALLAQQVTSAGRTPFQKADLLQSWFRDSNQFFYDLSVSYGYGYNALGQFLEQRRGFCQQFAATMAIMAREVGIPSRIVVGFLEPTRRDADGVYVMTTDDVHAWPELWFTGVGWVRFEPTPRSQAGFPDYAPSTGVTLSTETAPTSAPTSQDTALPTRDGQSSRGEDAAASGGGGGSGPVAPGRTLLVVLAIVAVALLPAGLRIAVRRARMSRPLDPPEAAESAWLEVRDRIRDLRLPWTGSMTPRARERALAPLLHGDSDGLQALHRLSNAVERARYAVSLPATSPAADAREVMAIVARQTARSQRVKAFLWPTSLMPDIRRGWQRLARGMRRRGP